MLSITTFPFSIIGYYMVRSRNTIFLASSDIKVDINPIDHSVKITHMPTGTIAAYNRYKSAHKNKIEALLILRKMLSESRAGYRNNGAELRTVII